ncbi:MAG: S-layer family protein [Lentisphaerae bacterium]|nr:S-layer family protein [Lentisphaerota bacterium]MCP4103332.1 S-layer family protein [Lentisphaerota bacterium]
MPNQVSNTQSKKSLYAQKKYPQFKVAKAPKKPKNLLKRQHSSSFMPIWTCQIANYLFYRQFLQAYKAEEMMIYQIKWAKNMGASAKRPKDYVKIIQKLESSNAIKSGTGVYFGYNDKDIINYFMRDGLELQGNANGFIKSSGIGKELIATLDIAKILNPFSYFDNITTIGGYATVGLSFSPSTKMALGAKYDKNKACFILQYALPNQKCLRSIPLGGYMNKGFWNMKGFKIDKCLSAEFQLGITASASFSLGPSISNHSVTNKHGNLNYCGQAGIDSDVGVTLTALEGAGRHRVENLIFVANRAAYFSDNTTMRRSISKDVLNVLSTYDFEKQLTYEKQKSILSENYKNNNCRVHRFDDCPAYVYILTTTHSRQVELGQATLLSRLRINNQANLNYQINGKKYVQRNQEINQLNLWGNLLDFKAKAHIYERKASYKKRKSRLCLPFKPYPNSKRLYICNQDTEILYSKEKAYSFMGYSAIINSLCAVSLEYENYQDPLEDDVIWKDIKEEMFGKPNSYELHKGIITEGKSFSKNLYENSEYSENTLMYTSINHIFRPGSKKKCKGSCFNIGRSIDLTTLTIFYEKYFRLKAIISKTSLRSLKFLLNRKEVKITDCFSSKTEFYEYKERAKEILSDIKITKPKKKSFFKKLCSISSTDSLSQRHPYGDEDVVLSKFSVEKFKSLSANSGMKRRKTVTAIDKALKGYWDHVITYSGKKDFYNDLEEPFREINARIGLLSNIIDECYKWKKSHKFTNVRRPAIDNLISACKATIDYYTDNNNGLLQYKKNALKFKVILEFQKVITLFKTLEVMFESLNIPKRVGLEYILPGNNHQKNKGVIGLIFDLVGRENIKAAIFETVFDLDLDYLAGHVGSNVCYYSNDRGKDFKDIKLPTKNYLKQANEKTNVGFRILYRREDSFENRTNIFQLGTRLMPVQSRQKFDLNLSFSYQHQQNTFTGISLHSASNPWRKNKNIDDYYKTILVS